MPLGSLGQAIPSAPNTCSTVKKKTLASFPERTLAKKPAISGKPEAIPQGAVEDAYRILKVAAGDSRDDVEAARRKIVLKTSLLVAHGMHSPRNQKLFVRRTNGE